MSDESSSFERALAIFNGTAADTPPAPHEPVTREMVDLFRRGTAIQRLGLTGKWEDEGGRRREYFDICNALHRALGRKPWEACFLDEQLDDEAGRWARARLEAYVPRLVTREGSGAD
jgi:hypothetical protein